MTKQILTFPQIVIRNFNAKDLAIKIEKNKIEIKNNFKETPAFYTYVIHQNGKKVEELPYSYENIFQYEFKFPGEFEILAYVRAKGNALDRKSLPVSVTVTRQARELVAKVQ